MTHLSREQLTELEALLMREHSSLIETLKEHGVRVNGNWQGTPEGFDENDSEAEDAADAMEELATNVPLVEELERRLVDVERALTALKDGTYGYDEVTKEPILLERLRANPAARTNV